MILFLTLKRKWFAEIAAGIKTEEIRELKPYWIKRLFKKSSGGLYDQLRPYTEIHFRNGYSKDSPFMRVEFKGVWITDNNKITIKLGRILEVKNWPVIEK